MCVILAMKNSKNRKYISIYFPDRKKEHKRGDITLSIGREDILYGYMDVLSSRKIKNLININNFVDLEKLACSEGRSVNNFIKHRLRRKLTSSQD